MKSLPFMMEIRLKVGQIKIRNIKCQFHCIFLLSRSQVQHSYQPVHCSYKLSRQTRTAIPQQMQFYVLWHLVFHICVLLCTQKNLQFPFRQTLLWHMKTVSHLSDYYFAAFCCGTFIFLTLHLVLYLN